MPSSDPNADLGSKHNNNNNNNVAKNDVMKRISSMNAAKAANIGNKDTSDLAPFNPSSIQIQEMAMEIMNLSKGDVLFDLGCGDGRFLCFAASRTPGLRCVGVEIDALYVSRARDRVKEGNLESRVDIRLEDATKAFPFVFENDDDDDDDCDEDGPSHKPVGKVTLANDATALYLFILPRGIVRMMPILESLKKRRLSTGKKFRVLSYMFKIHDWEAKRVDETAKGSCPVYYYEFVTSVK